MIETLYAYVEQTARERGLSETERALPLMKKYHEGQYRKGKEAVPYIIHPLTMARHALALGICEDVFLAAVLLHDVVEDCPVTIETLGMSEKVNEAVLLLTFSIEEGFTKQESKARYFQRIGGNRTAALIKLMDRCHNVSGMAAGFSKEKMQSYIEETQNYIYPLMETVKENWPEDRNTVFLLEYQIKSVIETIKQIL